MIYNAAAAARSRFPDMDMNDEEARRCTVLDDALEAACGPCEAAGVDLIKTKPTTLAGVDAAIQYIRIQVSNEGIYMPHPRVLDTGGKADDTAGWIDTFLSTVAAGVTVLANVLPIASGA